MRYIMGTAALNGTCVTNTSIWDPLNRWKVIPLHFFVFLLGREECSLNHYPYLHLYCEGPAEVTRKIGSWAEPKTIFTPPFPFLICRGNLLQGEAGFTQHRCDRLYRRPVRLHAYRRNEAEVKEIARVFQ